VSLGTLSVSRPPGTPDAKASGIWRATETTEGDREATTSSSFAPVVRPVCLKVRERSTGLLACLQFVRHDSSYGALEGLLKTIVARPDTKFLACLLQNIRHVLSRSDFDVMSPEGGINNNYMRRHDESWGLLGLLKVPMLGANQRCGKMNVPTSSGALSRPFPSLSFADICHSKREWRGAATVRRRLAAQRPRNKQQSLGIGRILRED